MKLLVGNEELNFKMTNQTVFDIDEKFNNYGEVINGIMYTKNLYNNALKIISCCCIDKELSLQDLINNLTSTQINEIVVDFALELYFEYRGFKKKDKSKKEVKETSKKK